MFGRCDAVSLSLVANKQSGAAGRRGRGGALPARDHLCEPPGMPAHKIFTMISGKTAECWKHWQIYHDFC